MLKNANRFDPKYRVRAVSSMLRQSDKLKHLIETVCFDVLKIEKGVDLIPVPVKSKSVRYRIF